MIRPLYHLGCIEVLLSSHGMTMTQISARGYDEASNMKRGIEGLKRSCKSNLVLIISIFALNSNN
jgi:hypothetical protein